MKIVNEKNIAHRFICEKVGDIRINNVTISILNPAGTIALNNDISRRFDKTNDDAIVMKIAMGNVSVVLPADISEPSKMRIIDAIMISGVKFSSLLITGDSLPAQSHF